MDGEMESWEDREKDGMLGIRMDSERRNDDIYRERMEYGHAGDEAETERPIFMDCD